MYMFIIRRKLLACPTLFFSGYGEKVINPELSEPSDSIVVRSCRRSGINTSSVPGSASSYRFGATTMANMTKFHLTKGFDISEYYN